MTNRLYLCNRSGFYYAEKSADKLSRQLKIQGSRKSGKTCPAHIEWKQINGSIQVVYYKTHAGHDCAAKHLPLPQSDVQELQAKVAYEVSGMRILKDARESLSQRTALITNKDLKNVSRSLGSEHTGRYDQNDATSIDIWQKVTETNGDVIILAYKKQGMFPIFWQI